jgi:uncharacterized protein YvpB
MYQRESYSQPVRRALGARVGACLVAAALLAVLAGVLLVSAGCNNTSGSDYKQQITAFHDLESDSTDTIQKQVLLDVPAIDQGPELPTGCEATAVTMLLQYDGCDVNKLEIADEMPRSTDDYNEGFIGDPYSDDFSGPFYPTIFPPAFRDLVIEHAGSFTDLTGCGLNGLIQTLDSGKPVVCWVTQFGGGAHAVCVTGYDEYFIYYNDPGDGSKNDNEEIASFLRRWADQNYMSLTY